MSIDLQAIGKNGGASAESRGRLRDIEFMMMIMHELSFHVGYCVLVISCTVFGGCPCSLLTTGQGRPANR